MSSNIPKLVINLKKARDVSPNIKVKVVKNKVKVNSKQVCSKISEIDEDCELPQPVNDKANVKMIKAANRGLIEPEFDNYNKKVYLQS